MKENKEIITLSNYTKTCSIITNIDNIAYMVYYELSMMDKHRNIQHKSISIYYVGKYEGGMLNKDITLLVTDIEKLINNNLFLIIKPDPNSSKCFIVNKKYLLFYDLNYLYINNLGDVKRIYLH